MAWVRREAHHVWQRQIIESFLWECGTVGLFGWVLLSGALAESLALSLSFCDIEFIEFDMLSNFNSWWEWQWMIVSLSFKNSCERSSSLGCYLRSSRFVTLIVVKPLEHYLLGKDNHHLFWSVIYYLKSILIKEREKNK